MNSNKLQAKIGIGLFIFGIVAAFAVGVYLLVLGILSMQKGDVIGALTEVVVYPFITGLGMFFVISIPAMFLLRNVDKVKEEELSEALAAKKAKEAAQQES